MSAAKAHFSFWDKEAFSEGNSPESETHDLNKDRVTKDIGYSQHTYNITYFTLKGTYYKGLCEKSINFYYI